MKLRNGTIRIFRWLNFAKWLWLGESTMNSGRRENYIELLQNKLHSRTPTSLRRFLYGQLSLTQLRCSHRQTRWSGCQFNLIVVWGLVVYHLAGPWDEIVKIENNNTTGVFTSINSDELSNWNVFETNSLEFCNIHGSPSGEVEGTANNPAVDFYSGQSIDYDHWPWTLSIKARHCHSPDNCWIR